VLLFLRLLYSMTYPLYPLIGGDFQFSNLVEPLSHLSGFIRTESFIESSLYWSVVWTEPRDFKQVVTGLSFENKCKQAVFENISSNKFTL
jgi:hypothetical protein